MQLTCIDSVEFECKCGDQAFPLLISGDQVKLGVKTFNPREIKELQTLNGGSNTTTYQIFEKIDQRTRNCEYEWGDLRNIEIHGYPFDYTGTISNGYASGSGFATKENLGTYYLTLDDEIVNGF